MDELDTLPELDYLSRDYASFRQLILDQLSVLVPAWTEPSPADIGNAVIDVLAYAADYLSYYQDAIATEAYLGTARLRRSIQRHVRLLDYDWHEGCNARVWVQVQVDGDTPIVLPAKTPVLSRLAKGGTVARIHGDEQAYASALAQHPVVFETLHEITLFEAHNVIHFYAKDPNIPLLKGETKAQLCNGNQMTGPLHLKPGDVLIFEERFDPVTGLKSKADPTHRQAVRLTQVTEGKSESGDSIVEIEWSAADALAFPLSRSTLYGGSQPVSVALGNIVLADHGQTILHDELLPAIPDTGRYYPKLRQNGLTFRVAYDHEHALTLSASDTLLQAPNQALPDISLVELGLNPIDRSDGAEQPLLLDTYHGKDVENRNHSIKKWTLRPELLSSGTFTRDYAVETEEDGGAYLRFGYGVTGWRPAVAGAHCLATYRIGNGAAGNIGPDALAHVVTDIVTDDARIKSVRNPMAAQGGTNPSDRENARLHAPAAFQQPERCVTEADYAAIAGRYPHVVQAVAQLHWTGSRTTAVIYVQRRGDQPVDRGFQLELRRWLEPFRVAGHDIEIREANFVPLDIELSIFVKLDHRLETVRKMMTAAFSNRVQPDGTDGFFNPAHFTFGKVVYRSQVIQRAMQVPGVARVDVVRFRRMDSTLDVESIPVGPLEIIRLDNDPNNASQGKLVFSYKYL